MRAARCLASFLITAVACQFPPLAAPEPVSEPGCPYERCALGFGPAPDSTNALAHSTPEIQQHYRAANRHYSAWGLLGVPTTAAYLMTVGYILAPDSVKGRFKGIPEPRVVLPLSTVALGVVSSLFYAKGENHVRRAVWLHNRSLPSVGPPESECPYDRCALRLRTRGFSMQLVQGASEVPLGRLNHRGPRLEVFETAGDSVRFHYNAFRELRVHHARVGRFVTGTLVGALVVFVATDSDDDARNVGYGLLFLGYAVGHMSMGSAAAAETHFEQAIWHYNRRLTR